MRLREKKLLIFDFDGTLIDSVPDLAVAVNLMLERLGRETFSEETIRFWVGNGAQTLVLRALSGSVTIDADISQELFENALSIFLEFYRSHACIKTSTYEGVDETLALLKSRGYILTIVTNKPSAFIKPILQKLQLENYFSLALGADSLSEKKPHPMPLLHLCQTYGVPIENAVMIGDSKNDILAAQAANIDSIAVTYGYNYGEDISSYNPTLCINKFRDILDSLS